MDSDKNIASEAATNTIDEKLASRALNSINIPNINDIRGNVTLPTTLDICPGAVIDWHSSDPTIVSDVAEGKIAAGRVTRPPIGASPATVTLTASIELCTTALTHDFVLTIRPSVKLAQFSRYGMTNFARSNSTAGQQIYFSTSVANEATSFIATNNGKPVLTSKYGMHGLRDPSIVRSPEGDKFYLVATDLNVDGTEYGWQGWGWAQSGCSRFIEVWESFDLVIWSNQRHIQVSPLEAGMTYAPEAIWDPEIGAYVVCWTSSMYPADTYFTTDREDPKGRWPLTRNQTLFATTRDFVSFSQPGVMSGREGHGTLDAVMIRDDEDGFYHRFVCDRISTGVGVTKYAPCPSEDIYQERAKSVLAKEEEWELVATGITHEAMNTTYAEAPLVFKANTGDPHGKGYYFFSDQIWEGALAGKPMEEQLQPYWADSLASGKWMPISWTRKPEYDEALGVIRHGTIFNLTCAEHAALRGAQLSTVSVKPPRKTHYTAGEVIELEGLVVSAIYSDGVMDEEIFEGYGGYFISGLEHASLPGKHAITVSYAVLGEVKSASFEVEIQEK